MYKKIKAVSIVIMFFAVVVVVVVVKTQCVQVSCTMCFCGDMGSYPGGT